jgi:hypothetical protein
MKVGSSWHGRLQALSTHTCAPSKRVARSGFQQRQVHCISVSTPACAGCVAGWRQRQREDPAALPARVEAAVASLEALLRRMPLDDPKVHSCRCSRADNEVKF